MADDITVYDELGRPLRISQEKWIAEILPGLLEEAWDDVESLYARCAQALLDGICRPLADAAERLMELAPEDERVSILNTAVALETGQIELAEDALARHVARHGRSGIALTNEAKILAKKGDLDAAKRVLLEGLELDPNQDVGVEWWASLGFEADGKAGYVRALTELAAIPGSWRPQLWLARSHLEDGTVDAALRLYDQVVDLARADGEALMMITGDLGSAGCEREALDLVEQIYDVDEHGPYAGMNLLRSLILVERFDDARDLLDALQRLHAPQLGDHLAELERELLEGRDAPEVEDDVTRLVVIDGPIWAHGSSEAVSLLPQPAPAGEEILFLSFADLTRAGESSHVEAVTGFGRCARSLPLYLSEALYFQTDAKTRTLVPVVKGAGPVLAGQPWDLDWLAESCPDDMRPSLIVEGRLVSRGGGDVLEMHLHDVASDELGETLCYPVTGGSERLAPRIEADLIDVLERAGRLRRRRRRGIWRQPPPELVSAYQHALGDIFTQLLCSNDLIDRRYFGGQHDLVTSYFELIEDMPAAVIPKILAVRAVLEAMRYGSPVAEHFVPPLLRIIEQEPKDSPLAEFLRRLGDQLRDGA